MPALIHHSVVTEMSFGSDLCAQSAMFTWRASVLHHVCTPFLYLAAFLSHHSSITAVTEWGFLSGWVSLGGWDIYSLKKKTGQKEKIQKLSSPPWGTAGWWTVLFNSVKSAQNVLTPPHWLSWQKTHGGILLEAGTALECLAITLPLIKMILTSAFNQLL